MKRIIKVGCVYILLPFFLTGPFGCKKDQSPAGESGSGYEWVTVDEDYIPQDYVEEFIKNDSAKKGLLPVQIINYGSDKAVLRRFKGKNFARPTEAQLKMMYKGLGEWKLIDLKYSREDEREIQRTILYVYVNGDWMVGDSGSLLR
ncbi:MAG: hypothetical protein PVF22_00380 [Candidatus Aminicenantes bacterium]|jgi:hypothetical protein